MCRMQCELLTHKLNTWPVKGLPVTLFDPTEVSSIVQFPSAPLLRSINVIIAKTFIVGTQKTAATFSPLPADVPWK